MIKQTRVTGRCPFLETDEEGHGHDCVSHPGSPEPITPRHVDSFCRNERPFACPRFVGADPGLLRAYLRQLAYRRTANVKNDRDDKETAAPTASSQHGPRTGVEQATLSQPGVAPAAPHRQIETPRPPDAQLTSGHELLDDVGPTGKGRISEASTVPVRDHVEIEQARVGTVREASIQGDAGGDTVPSSESEAKPIAMTRTESSLRTDIEVVPSTYAGESAKVDPLLDQLETGPGVSLGTVHEEVPAELLAPDAQLPPVLPAEEIPSHTHAPPRNVAVTATPPLTDTPATVDAQPISLGETVAVPTPDPAETIQPFEQKLPAGVKSGEITLENNPADHSTLGPVVHDWSQDRDATTVHEVPVNTPSAMSGHAAAPSSSVLIESMVHHDIPAFQNPPQATPRPQRQGRRRYIIASAATVVLLAGIGLLLRHATSRPISHAVLTHSRVPVPTTIWSFRPLQPGVDQILFTFSNRGTSAVNVQVKAPSAKDKIVKSIRMSADSGEEITLDSRAAYGALVVHASGPVVVARTSVHHGSVQYTYGNPVVRRRHP